MSQAQSQPQNTHCLNCSSPISPSQKYCGNCGQTADVHRVSWHDIKHDSIHYFTHADKGIFFVLKELTKNAGLVAREYLAGMRKKYMSPITFFLLGATVYVLAFYVVPEVHMPASADPQMAVYNERGHKMNEFMRHYSKFISIAALPFISAIYWLFYRKGKYNFTEHLVANMFMTGYSLYAGGSMLIILALIFPGSINFVSLSVLLFQLVYYTYFYSTFMKGTPQGGWGKSFLASFTGILLWFIFSAGLVTLYIYNGFWGLGD